MDTNLAEPDARSCYLNGLLRLRAGQPGEATVLLRRALHDRPGDPDVRRNLIRALLATRDFPAVLDQTAIALKDKPDDAEFLFAKGTALSALQRPLDARAALTRSVVLRPSLAAAWLNLGNVCVDLDDRAEAERHYRVAIRLNPGLAQAFASLGHLLLGNGRIQQASEACQEAVRLAPGMAEAHWNLAIAHLLAGDLTRGLRAYEWRKRHPAFRHDFPPLPGPYWSGGDPSGKTILVRAEQGFGDTIQFARYLRTLAERGATPVLRCDPRLVRLLSRLPGVLVLPTTANVEGHDAWIDAMSLPLALGGIPFADGYLGTRASPPNPKPRRVGIVWAGNPGHSNDARRSIPAQLLTPLLATPGVSFVNLQVGPRARDLPLPDLTPCLTDFAETAALIETLDLVIAADTAVAHLAGALGVPVWVLLPHVPDWRWMLHRDQTPWYASARLFRQQRAGDWADVIGRVVVALSKEPNANKKGDGANARRWG